MKNPLNTSRTTQFEVAHTFTGLLSVQLIFYRGFFFTLDYMLKVGILLCHQRPTFNELTLDSSLSHCVIFGHLHSQ